VNLPEYRRALRQAHEEYAEELRAAGERLMKAIEHATAAFTEEENVPMEKAERRKEPGY
jgi:hypothetical protein